MLQAREFLQASAPPEATGVADSPTVWIDLFGAENEDRYARRPDERAQRLAAADPAPAWVVTARRPDRTR